MDRADRSATGAAQDHVGAAVNAAASPVLEVQGIHKTFGATPALRGMDVSVRRGEVLAVTGPSGSGKSTLLHCMAGVFPPDSGAVTYQPDASRADSVLMSELDETERSQLRLKDFGFVFQNGQLLPELSALDNVALPLLMLGVRRKVALERASAFLEKLELSELGESRVEGLSGGQAQRIAVARALVTEPAVLFADEPTGSLDSLSAETVLALMLDLVQSSGTTLVMITHDPRVAAYADRDVVVRDGRIGDR